MSGQSQQQSQSGSKEWTKLAFVFLKLGVTAFGGPAAHIALMENEFVRKRKWLTSEKFLDLLGAASLIPGPSSSELAIYIGQLQGGLLGLIIAGVCFILPASLIVLAFAWGYARFGSLPEVTGILYGIKPIIISIIIQAFVGLGKTALKTKSLGLIAIFAFFLNLRGLSPIQVILSGGLASVIIYRCTCGKGIFKSFLLGMGVLLLLTLKETLAGIIGGVADGVAGSTQILPTLSKIFLVFLKVGSTQFGSGYVLLAFLRADLVERWHWITEVQLLDAIIVGQFTPGPVFTTATFIGYLLKGLSGAVVATLGIFLPAFVLVLLSGSLIPRIRKLPSAGAFLDGVNVASLALMVGVSLSLGKVAIVDSVTAVLLMLSLLCLIKTQINSAILVFFGGAVGVFKLYF